MNKKLLAVAVAGMLAAPAVAFAQSSVTISGYIRLSFGNYKLGNAVAAPVTRAAGTRTSEARITDDSSQIQFSIREDLGGGLAAIGQWNVRWAPDSGADGGPAGNSFVGLQSKSWGTLLMGRYDLHYFNRESELTVKADLKGDSISLLSFMQNAAVAAAAGGQSAVANATRTPNVIRYLTPNWGGFTMIAAYSTNPGGAAEADLGTAIRTGRAWNLNPNLQGPNYQIGYSYWDQKNDASAFHQRSDRLYGSYKWGGFKLGLAWDKSRIKADSAVGAIAAGTETNRRTAWSLPAQYQWGPHNIYGHYTKARDDKATTAVQDGARMWALAYAYDLSKRTSLAMTYANIRNDTGAQYNFFTSASGAIGTPTALPSPGEDPRMLTVTVRHVF